MSIVKSLAEINKTVSGVTGIKEYGAKGDGISDDTEAFNLMITDINSKDRSLFIIPKGVYIITGVLDTITENFMVQGAGKGQTILLFKGVDGLSINLGDISVNQRSIVFRDLTFATDTSTKTGVSVVRVNDLTAQGTQAEFSYCSFNTAYNLGLGGTVTDEWLVGLALTCDNVDINHCFFNGAFNNLHTNNVSLSFGIDVNSSSNVKINHTRMYGHGVSVRVQGQSEDVSLTSSLIVGSGKGVLYTNLVSPSNNHVMKDTHIATWQECVEYTSIGDDSAYNFITDSLFLERETDVETKATWKPLNLSLSSSTVSNVKIQAGQGVGAGAESIGCTISDLGNEVHDFKTVYCDYILDVIPESISVSTQLKAYAIDSTTSITAEVKTPTIYTKLGSNAVVSGITYISGIATNT